VSKGQSSSHTYLDANRSEQFQSHPVLSNTGINPPLGLPIICDLLEGDPVVIVDLEIMHVHNAPEPQTPLPQL